MIADYFQYTVDELLAEEAVQDYLLGGDRDPSWAAARFEHPDFDARLREAELLLEALGNRGSVPTSPQEQALLAAAWQNIDSTLGAGGRDTLDGTSSTQTVPPATEQGGARIVELPSGQRRSINRRIYGWAAAVAAALILLFLLQPDGDSYRTAPGETELVYLPDSTAVWLAPASVLTVEEFGDRREVRLEGEAFFEVVRGTDFTVETPSGLVSVLGTSFRVESVGDVLHVRCQTGRVAVARADARVELTAGESVRSEGAGLGDKRREAPETEPAPGAASIVGRDVTVAELTARLARYYARTAVVSPSIADRRLTIELPTDDLGEATRRLAFVLRVSVDTSGNRIEVGDR